MMNRVLVWVALACGLTLAASPAAGPAQFDAASVKLQSLFADRFKPVAPPGNAEQKV